MAGNLLVRLLRVKETQRLRSMGLVTAEQGILWILGFTLIIIVNYDITSS